MPPAKYMNAKKCDSGTLSQNKLLQMNLVEFSRGSYRLATYARACFSMRRVIRLRWHMAWSWPTQTNCLMNKKRRSRNLLSRCSGQKRMGKTMKGEITLYYLLPIIVIALLALKNILAIIRFLYSLGKTIFRGDVAEDHKEQHSNDSQPEQPSQTIMQKKPSAASSLVVHDGILLAAGFAKTTYGYRSYRLEIQSDEFGASYEIWGIDLKRALDISGAKVGERIRASLVGCVETSLSDEGASKKTNKKIWAVIRLE